MLFLTDINLKRNYFSDKQSFAVLNGFEQNLSTGILFFNDTFFFNNAATYLF